MRWRFEFSNGVLRSVLLFPIKHNHITKNSLAIVNAIMPKSFKKAKAKSVPVQVEVAESSDDSGPEVPEGDRGDLPLMSSGPKPTMPDVRPVAVLSQDIDTPYLRSGTKDAIVVFESEYRAYERKLSSLAAQGVMAKPASIASCIAPAALKLICRHGLQLGSEGWMSVSDDLLRAHLFGRKIPASDHDVTRAIDKLRSRIVMKTGDGITACDAATLLFESVEELMEETTALVSEKRVCAIILDAIRPMSLRVAINRIVSDVEDWKGARKSARCIGWLCRRRPFMTS